MIITVTLNPALDKTAKVDTLVANGLNRLTEVTIDAGGKGVNVSTMINALGGKSIATGFAGGGAGDELLSLIDKKALTHDFVKVSGVTRTNLKVVDNLGRLTELNEPGPVITPDEWEAMLLKLGSYAKKGNFISLSGSLPQGLGKDTYKKLCSTLRKSGAKVFLDADSVSFKLALESPPDEVPHFIKPNTFELLQYFGKSPEDEKNIKEKEFVSMCQELLKKGIELVALSMGGEGAIFVTNNFAYSAPALDITLKSSVGAGDSMIGALLYGFEKQLSTEEVLKIAMASSAGACTTTGTNPPDTALVHKLINETILLKIF
jgi:1-phosphofructokinase